MIHQHFVENVFFSTEGAGFKRKALWRCRTGPHPLFDLIGSVAVIYSSGAQLWLVIRGYPPTDLTRDEVVAREPSFALASEEAQRVVNMIYISHLEKERARAQPIPAG